MVQGGEPEIAAWINHYREDDSQIAFIVNLFQVNEEKLFLKRPPEKPDFQLEFPQEITKRVYVLVVKKIFAVLRHVMYKEIRKLIRARGNQTALNQSSASGASGSYLTKNELRRILEEIDIG